MGRKIKHVVLTTRPNPKIMYKCRYCSREFDTEAEFKKECGAPRVAAEHFKVGDLVQWCGRSVYEIRYLTDSYVGLYKPRDYITAFGLSYRHYSGPWAVPAGKFCKRSLVKYDFTSVVMAQIRLRKRQLDAAERILKHITDGQRPKEKASGDRRSVGRRSSVSGKRVEASARPKASRKVQG